MIVYVSAQSMPGCSERRKRLDTLSTKDERPAAGRFKQAQGGDDIQADRGLDDPEMVVLKQYLPCRVSPMPFDVRILLDPGPDLVLQAEERRLGILLVDQEDRARVEPATESFDESLHLRQVVKRVRQRD